MSDERWQTRFERVDQFRSYFCQSWLCPPKFNCQNFSTPKQESPNSYFSGESREKHVPVRELDPRLRRVLLLEPISGRCGAAAAAAAAAAASADVQSGVPPRQEGARSSQIRRGRRPPHPRYAHPLRRHLVVLLRSRFQFLTFFVEVGLCDWFFHLWHWLCFQEFV